MAFVPTIDGQIYVMIDFDGTVTTDRDDQYGEYHMHDNVVDVISRLGEIENVHLGLWTCRHGKFLRNAENFLANKGIYHYFEVINEDFTEFVEKFGGEASRKAGADIYFDDRCMLGKKIDWLELEEYIMTCLKEMEEE